MPITSGDLEFRYSTPVGYAGNTNISSPGEALGKWVSQTPIVSGTMANLFPNITGEENADSNVDYQCVFIFNKHPTATYTGAKVWVAADVPSGANAAIATDNFPPSAIGAGMQQAAVIPDKNTEPEGVSAFSAPTTKASGLALEDIGPGHVKAIWIERTATNSEYLFSDGVSIRVEGDSA